MIGGTLGGIFGAAVDKTSASLSRHIHREEADWCTYLVGSVYLLVVLSGVYASARFSWFVLPLLFGI